MAYLNLNIPNEARDTLKRDAKSKGMKFYPYLEGELVKLAKKLEQKESKNENV